MTNKIPEVEQLIDIVREYPIVYSRLGAIASVANNNEKNLAWLDIAKRLNDDPNRLKQKWRNLRDSYQKAIKYKRDLEEMGQLAKYREYRHEQRMEFLLPHVLAEIPARKKRQKTQNDGDYTKSEKITRKNEMSTFAIESQDVEYLVEDIVFSDLKRDHEEELESIIYKDQQEEMEQNNSTECLETESNVCYEEVESIAEMPEHPTPHPRELDDLDVWLSSVKASLLKLTKVNRARAKRDINTVLSNYEIEQYEAENN